VNRTAALAALGTAALAASFPVDGPAGIALALAGLAALALAWLDREHAMSPATLAARAELRTARTHLAAVCTATKEETPAYWTANARVAELERALPFWQQWDILATAPDHGADCRPCDHLGGCLTCGCACPAPAARTCPCCGVTAPA
jgi:hypothetical protein